MVNDRSHIEVTVVIPTFNGAALLAEVLDAIRSQVLDVAVETIVIDSGSTDATLDIVRSRPWVRLHQIPNREFGHGRTRNLGARLASGRIVAFLTQDATPASSTWLRELIRPLDDPRVAGVVGRQIPRPGCFPLLKYEIQGTFRAIGPDEGVTIAELAAAEPTDVSLDRLAFYSDVNAAARRAFLVDDTPYRDLPYSEDLAFGRDIIRAGHRRAYAAEGAVIHSNQLSRREYGKRLFDETTALRRIGAAAPRTSRLGAVLRATRGIAADSLRIMRDPEFGAWERIMWLLRNPAYHVTKWSAVRRASAIEPDDLAALERHSLEAERTR